MPRSVTNLQLLMDRADIQDVHTQYFQGLDQQDAEKIRGCFIENVEMVYDKLPTVRGLEAFMAEIIAPFFESMKAKSQRYGRMKISNHFMGNLRFNSLDGAEAETETYVLSMSVREANETDMVFIRSLRYLDRFLRLDGGWRIGKRVQTLDWSCEVPSSYAATIASRVMSI